MMRMKRFLPEEAENEKVAEERGSEAESCSCAASSILLCDFETKPDRNNQLKKFIRALSTNIDYSILDIFSIETIINKTRTKLIVNKCTESGYSLTKQHLLDAANNNIDIIRLFSS